MFWSIIRENDDNLADVRISIGKKAKWGSYIVFRGDPKEVVVLLEESLQKAREALQTGDYEDKRGRPQG